MALSSLPVFLAALAVVSSLVASSRLLELLEFTNDNLRGASLLDMIPVFMVRRKYDENLLTTYSQKINNVELAELQSIKSLGETYPKANQSCYGAIQRDSCLVRKRPKRKGSGNLGS